MAGWAGKPEREGLEDDGFLIGRGAEQFVREVQSGPPAVGQTDTFRWERSYAETFYCDTASAGDDGIGVGVLDRRTRKGQLNTLEQPEPAWKTRESWCERCAEPRTNGWCDTCRDRFCPTCDRCKCAPHR